KLGLRSRLKIWAFESAEVPLTLTMNESNSGTEVQLSWDLPPVWPHCTPPSGAGSVYEVLPPVRNGRRSARTRLPDFAWIEALCASVATSAESGATFAVAIGPR